MNHDAFLMEHLDALLADRALQGADAAEEAGIRCLLQHHDEVDAESLDRIAAALDLAYSSTEQEAMPASLMNRLLVQAASIPIASSTSAAQAQQKVVQPVSPAVHLTVKTTSQINSALTWTGWLVAAVVFLFAVVPSGPPVYSPQQLIAMGAKVVTGQKGPHGTDQLKGEFIWDSKTQQGYMKLAGFEVNNPAQKQYQLWIFDERQFTVDTPIDGGVFDVTNSNEVLIPIKANIKVGQAKLFAITVEKPGGTTKSLRDPLIFLGPVAANPKS